MPSPDPTPSDWSLTRAPPPESERRDLWRKVAAPAMTTNVMIDPAGYLADQALIDACNAALMLGQPLLLMGPPGCGKTEAAHFLAWRLGLEETTKGRPAEFALRFDTKSTTAARDLFYTYDAINRFYAAQVSDPRAKQAENFLSLHALGKAIIRASSEPHARALEVACGLPASSELRRSVVLIDEIDKAPRDVPNDLLVEVDKAQFFIQELNQTFRAQPEFAPIIVLTSNSEQALPDAFLRRCVFHHLEAPTGPALERVLGSRIRGLSTSSDLLGWLVNLFGALRDEGLERPPGTAELLGFAEILSQTGRTDARGLKASSDWYGLARAVLLKNQPDRERIDDEAMKRLAAS
jgi:MoxR-like ATPase